MQNSPSIPLISEARLQASFNRHYCIAHPLADEAATLCQPDFHAGGTEPLISAAAAHLAIDEALLDAAEAGLNSECLRLWQFPYSTVVLGRGSKFEQEVDLDCCRHENVEVTRRCSGGATIVAGPGCLMYSVVLDLNVRPSLRHLDRAHDFVMESLTRALEPHLAGVKKEGTCDLVWRNRKFSGNSLRVARNHLLYHGTLLYAADLRQIARLLRIPPRQPEYRIGRTHEAFITNVPLDRQLLEQCVVAAFGSSLNQISSLGDDDAALIDYLGKQSWALATTRYGLRAWTERH